MWRRCHFSDFVGHESTFALEVRGESMIDDHICSGDYVLAEKTDSVKNRRHRGGAGGWGRKRR